MTDYESVNVTIKKDGQSVQPVYTENVDVDSIGSSSRMADGCGNSTTQNTSSTGWQVTIEGTITDSQWQTLREMNLMGESATLITDPISDTFILETLHLSQTDELNAWVEDGLDDEELAYSFQIQTKDENNGGA